MNQSTKSILNRYTSQQSEKKSSHMLSSAKKLTEGEVMSPFQYEDHLLETSTEMEHYDPFESPPNLLKAQRHSKAMSIGVPIISQDIKNIQLCPCCQNPINKQPIAICCEDEELLFLGVGYSLYYKLARYIAYMVMFVFFVSGSGLYFLLTAKCRQEDGCVKFLGMNVVNVDPLHGDGQARTVEFMNMLTALGIFGFALYMKSQINKDITHLESKTICPSQYTIMLQNLPRNFDQLQLKNWVREKFGYEPVTINCCYDVQELEGAYEKRNDLTIELRKMQIGRSTQSSRTRNSQKRSPLKPASNRYIEGDFMQSHLQLAHQRQLAAQIQKCDKIIYDYQNSVIDCDKNGTAFVTFQNVQSVVEILQKYEKNEITNFFTRTVGSVMRDKEMVFGDRVVRVCRAPAPREVIWQNLSFSYFKSFIFQLFFILSMCLLIYFAFQYQFMFSAYAYRLRVEGKQSGRAIVTFQAVIASLIVVLLNALLRIIIYAFTKLKRYHSHTAEQSSFCLYYTLIYVFNSCFMIYTVHGEYPEESGELLLIDIHLIMLANAFSQPLFKLCDPTLWQRVIWRKYITTLPQERNPYTQMYLHSYSEGHLISNGDNYQYLARMLIIPIWFSHAAPLGIVFSLLGMMTDYWIGKVMLLRCYKRPQNVSKDIASVVINIFQFLPVVYICGLLQYTYKRTEGKVSIVQFLMSFFNYSITGTVLIISVAGYLLFFKSHTVVISRVSYSSMKNYMGVNYETQNPMTRYRGDFNYLQGLMSSRRQLWMTMGGDREMLDELRGDLSGDQDKRRMDLARVKIKMEYMDQKEREQIVEQDIEMRDLSVEKVREDSVMSGRDSQQQRQKKLLSAKKRENYFLKRTKSIFV